MEARIVLTNMLNVCLFLLFVCLFVFSFLNKENMDNIRAPVLRNFDQKSKSLFS